MYVVKDIFYSIQGEGAMVGQPAVFVRFAGCNQWSGDPSDRTGGSCAAWCDTEFRGGTPYRMADELSAAVRRLAPGDVRPYVILTGGEPALQVDDALVRSLHKHGCRVAIETNGTRKLPADIDWITVSPKAGAETVVRQGTELKLVFPQDAAPPERFEHLPFGWFFLQPLDGPNREAHTREAIEYCLSHPLWRLSLQVHKALGLA